MQKASKNIEAPNMRKRELLAECFGAGNLRREFAGQGISAIGY
jgi:hypothetical protein